MKTKYNLISTGKRMLATLLLFSIFSPPSVYADVGLRIVKCYGESQLQTPYWYSPYYVVSTEYPAVVRDIGYDSNGRCVFGPPMSLEECPGLTINLPVFPLCPL